FLSALLLALGSLAPLHAQPNPWAATGPLNVARYSHTASLLLNGKVLVAGGVANNGSTTNHAEIFDPIAGVHRLTAPMTVGRRDQTATVLLDGRVLVAGGMQGNTVLDSAELYDPVTGRWTVTGPMQTPRRFHTANLLSDGKVLVVAGTANGGVVTNSAEL